MKEINIFRNAPFGKIYKTRNGRKAIYVGRKTRYLYHVIVEGSPKYVTYLKYGRRLEDNNSNELSDYDIVSEWDSEKKELKNIEQKPIIEMKFPEESLGISSEEYNKIVDECIFGKQKPAWIEEDEVKMNRIVDCLENLGVADYDILLKDVDWLKSLKKRVQPQPKQEWSEDDAKHLNDIIEFGAHDRLTPNDIAWLKDLKDRYTWKPSEEQIEAIKLARSFVTDDFNEHPTLSEILMELEEQLKKLK